MACCGNFLSYLIDTKQLLPENLLVIGVGDYPIEGIGQSNGSFAQSYLNFEKKGCSFFPVCRFNGGYIQDLKRFLHERIKTPYIYVSLDLDVGAYRCVHAARYMDAPGIDRESLLSVADVIADGCRHRKFALVGFDVMEFNMHFLGIKVPGGAEDQTIPFVHDFISTLAAT